MCGIVGIYNFRKKQQVDRNILKSMTDVITHRGPDGCGYYFDDENGIGFGHRRLSIIDIDGGHQPMITSDGNCAITFNGEIYNYKELKNKKELNKYAYQTSSDTEVLLNVYRQYNLNAMDHLNGIFAFGIWDKNKRGLLISRDHLGVKPLYYFYNHETFIFSSEIKSILKHPAYNLRIDETSIDIFLTFKHNPAPTTLFKDIRILPPGSYITVTANGVNECCFYWDTASTINYSLNLNEWLDLLSVSTQQAVERQMVSDVPISISLSGGIDSNLLLSIICSKLPSKISSFTIGFTENEKVDEVKLALESEKFFNTKVYTQILNHNDFQEWFDKYIWHLEEPLGNESAMAYYFVAKLAHDHNIKVLLSGQGADELFGGYPRYIGEKFHHLFPSMFKNIFQPISTKIKNEQLRRSLFCLPEKDEVKRFFYVYSIFLPREKQKYYNNSFLREINLESGINYINKYFNRFTNHTSLDKMLHIDTRFSLADNLLLAGDKMSMAASVEARVPFLDIDYVKLVESIPARFKVNKLSIKYIHKANAKRFLPEKIIQRKKIGFTNPMSKWLVTHFNEEFNKIIEDKNSIVDIFFNKNAVKSMFEDHKNGLSDHKRHLFLIYSLSSWFKTFIN